MVISVEEIGKDKKQADIPPTLRDYFRVFADHARAGF
jgi:hypothetical protein